MPNCYQQIYRQASMRLLTTSNELARIATLNTMLRDSSLYCEPATEAELKARYKLLSRRAMDHVLDDAIVNPSAKIAAIHGGLAATRDQVKFSQDLGILKRAPIKIQNFSLTMPFEADPVLKEAMMVSLEKQRKEKQAMLAATQKENDQKDYSVRTIQLRSL